MVVRRSRARWYLRGRARLLGWRSAGAGGAGGALAGGAWPLPGWRCWRPAACLAHGRARLLGSLALALVLFIGWRLWPAPVRYAPPPVSYPAGAHGPRRHDRPRLRRGPAHHAAALRLCHRRTPRRKRPRPAAEGIYRARSRLPVSYANMPPIIPQPVQSAQKIATDFCAKIIPRPPKGGPWEGISAY